MSAFESKLETAIDAQSVLKIESIVRGAVARSEEGLTATLVTILREALGATPNSSVEQLSEDWVGIESLSRLRGVVGGRFQNIKKKWVDAGFPLREHRGDRWKDFTIDRDGWLELATWIAKQGFEARLTPESEEYLFELRTTKSAG